MRSPLKSWINDNILLYSIIYWCCVLIVINLDHIIKYGVHVFFEKVFIIIFNIEG